MTRRLVALALCLLLLPVWTLAATPIRGPVYEVFVASFRDGDGDRRGDLKGLAEALPYVKSLGADAIWMMPIHPSPSYHKYDVVDYMGIDPMYGTLADFDALVAAAREQGIGLILDLVINHSSREHPWFLAACQALAEGRDSPYIPYYVFSQEQGHPVPHAPGWYYAGHFGPHMPEINLDDPDVRREIVDILSFWLARGVAGFRLDATTHYYEENTGRNTAFLNWLTSEARRIKPDVYIVGEAWKDESTTLALYESGIDSLFPFQMAGPTGWLVELLRDGNGREIARRVAGWQEKVRTRNPLALDAPFISNHDQARSSGFLMRNDTRIKQAAALYLTMPGIPFVYYGEELGMSGSGRDENKRLPMVWSAEPDDLCLPPAEADQKQRLTSGVQEQENDPNSLLSFYRQVIALRNQCPELTGGSVAALPSDEKALAAWRVTGDGSTATVLHNLGDQALSLPLPPGGMLGGWDTGAGVPVVQGETLLLPPHSGCIFR